MSGAESDGFMFDSWTLCYLRIVDDGGMLSADDV